MKNLCLVFSGALLILTLLGGCVAYVPAQSPYVAYAPVPPPEARRGSSAGHSLSRGGLDWRLLGLSRRKLALEQWLLGPEAPSGSGLGTGSVVSRRSPWMGLETGPLAITTFYHPIPDNVTTS